MVLQFHPAADVGRAGAAVCREVRVWAGSAGVRPHGQRLRHLGAARTRVLTAGAWAQNLGFPFFFFFFFSPPQLIITHLSCHPSLLWTGVGRKVCHLHACLHTRSPAQPLPKITWLVIHRIRAQSPGGFARPRSPALICPGWDLPQVDLPRVPR